jgi:decaprenylphospho-beta-D-ribofuranose 2-oxidase
MQQNFIQKVSNWGNFPTVEKEVKSEESYSKIKNYINNTNDIIARGNGRSYGDAALAEHIFSTKKLNKFISFDRINGILECEAGVMLSDILEVSVPQSYFLYVTPGTKFITVGGAIASNIHGKNHHLEGSFCECVIEFNLINERNEILKCSPKENSEIFWSTIGGMGLTGIILNAKFQLKRIETSFIRQESIKAENLDEIFNLFEDSKDWTYTVAWIDCLQKGKNIGRSIIMRGEHALLNEIPQNLLNQPLEIKKKFSPTIPFFFPNFILNNLSVKIFNYFYYTKQRTKTLRNFIDYETFFYPLDSIKDWNKIYGKAGFIQYQMVIPKENGKEGMHKILETIAKSGNGSFLAVLKLFGKSNKEAYNSFPMEGYTLALDFKVNKNLKKLVQKLDDIVESYGGRIYLAKDSMSRPSLTNYLKNIENSKFNSLQQDRILKRN